MAMNADGGRGIDLEGAIGLDAPWLLGLGIGLLAAGLIVLGVGLILALTVARSSRLAGQTIPTDAAAQPQPTGAHPVTLTDELSTSILPALWLIKWLLLIPHFIVLILL